MKRLRKAGPAAVLLAAALMGSVATLAFTRTTTPAAETQPIRTPMPTAPSTQPPSRAQRDNRFVLSQSESLRLVAWARKLRACLAEQALRVGEPVAHAKHIDLRLYSSGSPEELGPSTIACGDRLGEPPRPSSLQFRPGKLILYLPKQCLLDPKVRSSARRGPNS
jgi:hypothetical protein